MVSECTFTFRKRPPGDGVANCEETDEDSELENFEDSSTDDGNNSNYSTDDGNNSNFSTDDGSNNSNFSTDDDNNSNFFRIIYKQMKVKRSGSVMAKLVMS